MNILEKANQIVNLRSEEKERQYGPFDESMERAAKILSGMVGKDVDAIFMYKAMVALKMSRESYNHKEDNLLDAVAYIGALHNYIEKKDYKMPKEYTVYFDGIDWAAVDLKNPDNNQLFDCEENAIKYIQSLTNKKK